MRVQGEPVTISYFTYPILNKSPHSNAVVVSEMRFFDPDKVIKAVENRFRVSWAEIRSKRRTQRICYPREILYYILFKYTTMTAEAIGQMIGGRDHTSVLSGKKRLKDLMDNEPAVRHEVKEIIENL